MSFYQVGGNKFLFCLKWLIYHFNVHSYFDTADKLEDMSTIRVPETFPEKDKLQSYLSVIKKIKFYVSKQFFSFSTLM